ncbi:MAG: NAD-dependent epimerase/dehydratase family protein [Actinopolymorphaceae bacterium]
MRVLVTGATGYIGRAVLSSLRSSGHDPVAMVRTRRPELSGAGEVRHGDLQDPASLAEAMYGVDSVCHLAGLTRARESWAQPMRYFQVNVGGTLAVLAAAETAGVSRLVFASTAAVYGAPDQQPMSEDLPNDPPHPYAASKAAAETAVEWQARSNRLGAVVIRLFNAAGGADPDPTRIIPRVLAVAAGEQEALDVNGDGSAVRDYLHVDDAAAAFVSALERTPSTGSMRRYNIGSGVGTSVTDVVRAAMRVTGGKIKVVHLPPAAEPEALVCNPALAMAELGWKPRRSNLDMIVGDAWLARSTPTSQR